MKREKYMKPLSNTVFLGIFANCETNPELEEALRGLINAIIDGKRPAITKINEVRAEDSDFGDSVDSKLIRIDLLVTDSEGCKYIIEVQLYYDLHMIKRNLVYVSRMIERQLEVGENYLNLKPVVMINITDFSVFDDSVTSDYYNVASLMLHGSHRIISGDLTLFFVELPKFVKAAKPSPLELWLEYFINYEDKEKRKELSAMSKVINAFDKAYEKIQSDDDAWYKYEFERRNREAYITGMMTAKEMGIAEGLRQGIAEGMSKGIAEGMSKGIAEGMSKGIELGKASGKAEAIAELIKAFKSKNMPIETISEYTGISPEEIKNI